MIDVSQDFISDYIYMHLRSKDKGCLGGVNRSWDSSWLVWKRSAEILIAW